MADINGFDADQVEPNKDFQTVPAGRYKAIITESIWEPNKAQTGRFIKFTLQVIEGEHKGAPLFDRLNLENPSDKAVQIAKGTLSSICRAVNVPRPKDTSELHNLPLIVRVDLEEYEPGKWSNPVKAYYPEKAAEAQPLKPTGTDGKPVGAAAGAGPSKPAWLKK